MGWFSKKPKVEIAIGIEIDGLDRDLYNVGGNGRCLRYDQKINILIRAGYPVDDIGEEDELDGIIGMLLG